MSPKWMQIALMGLALAALGGTARATQTDPVLEIARARAIVGESGTLVELDAVFPQAELVQDSIVLHVLVRDLGGAGTSYVRFSLGAAATSGVATSLADGFDAGDVAALLASGTPLAGARLLGLAPGRIELWLPAGIDVTAAEVHLFVVYEEDPILSNPAPVLP